MIFAGYITIGGINKMPRKARIFSKSELYHVIIRGNNKQNLFYDNQDYLFFLKRLTKYLNQMGIEIYAYCLMTNHVHLVIGKATKISLVTFMRKLEVSYVYYFNSKYERTGHLFQDRYKSEPISSTKQFQKTIRYVLQNPIKGGLSKTINYNWNSFNTSLKSDSIIAQEIIKREFGSLENYKHYIEQINDDKCMEYQNIPRKTDFSCLRFLRKNYKIKNPLLIDRYTHYKKQKILVRLKENGYSIRSISRITGISRKIIQLA